ncbi:MAG TPA: xylulokinase [Chroococcales cyanobacterium]
MSIFLGIDVGTSGTKTIAIDGSGKLLAEAVEFYPCLHPRPLWSEQNPEDWWRATVDSVRAVLTTAGIRADQVKAIGLSGQMHGAVFLDSADRVIRPAILWNDQRTKAECDEIETREGGPQALLQMVANPALTGFTAPKIIWLRKHEPHNFERVRKILLPKDDVRRRMTGEYVTDVSDAGGTLLLDVGKRVWCKPLLAALDLDIALLPSLCESPDVTGKLTPAAAELLGLTTDCLVVGGAGDCPANAVGTGIVSAGTLATSIGTSSVMMVHCDDFTYHPEGNLQTMCHAVPGKWFMMGVNLSGGGCLQWFKNALCRKESSEQRVGSFYDLLSSEAATVPPGSDGLMFLPYLSGERTPHNDPDARACFIGLTMFHQRNHMVRAIMEGVAYNMKENLQLIRALGIPVDQIRASGGGSTSAVWRQIQADVFDQAVSTINCDQGPAYGVALHAAVGAGEFSTVEEACRATIKIVDSTPATSDGAKYYRQAFPVFQELYKLLQPQFKALGSLETLQEAVSV